MSYPKPITASHHVSSPRAFRQQGAPAGSAPTGTVEPAGQVMAFPFSTVAQVIDLEAIGNPPFQNQSNLAYNTTGKGVVGNFITVHAQGQDLYLSVGATGPQVTGISAATVGAITASGTYQGATGAAWRVPANESLRFIPQPGIDRVMAVVASTGTGTCRIYQSNPSNGGSLT